MQSLLALLLVSISVVANAETVNITCHNGNVQTFNKDVDDATFSDGYIIAIKDNYTYVLNGDCIITVKDKP